MEVAAEHQPSSSPSDDTGKQEEPVPPSVITVDTKKETEPKTSTDDASQARTPKHANRVKETQEQKKRPAALFAASAKRQPPQQQQQQPQHSYPANFPPHYERVNANSNNHNNSSSSSNRRSFPPMQVSPGANAGRYFPPSFPNGPPPGRYPGYEQRFQPEYARFEQGPYRGNMPPYPPSPFPQGNEYGNRWGPPPFHGGARHMGQVNTHTGTGNTFSRAVSSSFDRSIKSQGNKGTLPHETNTAQEDTVSDDASWKMLNQVHSVDEEEMRKRQRRNKSASEQEPHSNSSSLTNSPTEGIDANKKSTLPDAQKLASSLDSLSSVASEREPIKDKAPSPTESTGSLDLMKCPSGSSQLLLPTHHQSLSQFSLPMEATTGSSRTGKRPMDEETRGDVESNEAKDSEIRRAPSGEPPAAKKSRTDKKTSPLSITCSPPQSPSAAKNAQSNLHQPQAVYPKEQHHHHSPGNYYDGPPAYSYSMDSGPPLPNVDSLGTTKMQHRRNSSAGNSIGSMNGPPAVGQLPSWEIHGQDSFGAGSVGGSGGGNGLISSFSFQQDYGMLGPSNSQDNGGRHADQHLESRNQSFDGGAYGQSFGRSDSMMSYEQRHGPYDGRQGYPGQYPPHAPSWGSAGSYHAQGYGGYRNSFPPMMRNYSEDSGATPPQGGMRVMPPGFQPPPEFQAPPSMVNKSGPQNTIMTSPYQPTIKSGPFGWTKEEDARLTEIMKKFKNPRDWEPIAKAHERGRTAKECNERWIRYLKPGARKGQWTDHEDAIVMEVVTNSSEQPFTRWSDLASRLPGRVGKQIRDRWVNHLNPAINHLPFSREDDLKLWDGHKKLGKRWVEISTKLFNSSRSENHIKNRWYSASFKKFINNEFGAGTFKGGKSKADAVSKAEPKKKKKMERRTMATVDEATQSAEV